MKKQKITVEHAKELSCKAAGVLAKAELMVNVTGKNSFQFSDIFSWIKEGKSTLYSALKELRQAGIIDYTPARYGNPAEYRLAFQLSGNEEPCINNKQQTNNKINGKPSSKPNTEYQFTSAELTAIEAVCQDFGFTEAFVLSLLRERMTRFNEPRPAIDLLIRRAGYSMTRQPYNFAGYVRTVFLMRDFVEPGHTKPKATGTAKTVTPEKQGYSRPGDRKGIDTSLLGPDVKFLKTVYAEFQGTPEQFVMIHGMAWTKSKKQQLIEILRGST